MIGVSGHDSICTIRLSLAGLQIDRERQTKRERERERERERN